MNKLLIPLRTHSTARSDVACSGLVPNIAGLAILLASDGRNSPGMSTDYKYGQCLLFEAPEDFQRLWYILEAKILSISLSKASQQLKEGQFDNALDTIHTIWAPSQAHSIVVDFLPPHVTHEHAVDRPSLAQWLSRPNERLVTLFVIVVASSLSCLESFGIVDHPWKGTTIIKGRDG